MSNYCGERRLRCRLAGDDASAGPGKVPQLADWGWRHERTADQAVRTQLGMGIDDYLTCFTPKRSLVRTQYRPLSSCPNGTAAASRCGMLLSEPAAGEHSVCPGL